MDKNNYLSIDIGGTQIKYALINHSGMIMDSQKCQTPDNLEDFLKGLDSIIANYQELIRGVAISCPGKVNSREGLIYFGGSLQYLHGLNLPQHIFQGFQLPCSVINDGKAAALSELWLGHLKGIDNGAAIILGTGVGGGIILNGHLLQGEHFQAGELSFHAAPDEVIYVDNMVGIRGSAVKLIEACAEALELDNLTDGPQVFAYINAKDERVYPIFEAYCRQIAFLIYNMQAVIDVKRYVIGGGISAQEIVVEEINKQYDKLHQSNELVQFMVTKPEILVCAHRNEANLLGALYQFLLNVEEGKGGG
ncbi:ROK family protein [Streptococcus plurextorum]|uniref:ROK family protein n=1 Tax=Streptococcus plurextorum TaxID=456876 RepID=UPI0004049CDB|nr:ROK family protein [Streptococcus plurextorum]